VDSTVGAFVVVVAVVVVSAPTWPLCLDAVCLLFGTFVGANVVLGGFTEMQF
jgi:hypothetical protein